MIVSIISATAYVLSLAIFFRAILSWFPAIGPHNPISEFLFTVTEPILAPLRRVIPRVGMMDVSPMIAILILAYVVPAIIHA